MVKVRGILCPTVTLYDAHGKVDAGAEATLVERLMESGLQGTVPLGTMGEFTNLTMRERQAVVVATQEVTPGGRVVLAGDIFPGTHEALDFARWLVDHGVDGVLAMSPFYIKPKEEGMLAHYRALAKVVGEGLFAYNLPAFSGYSLPNEVILALADEGTIQGLKDSEGNLAKIAHLLAHRPKGFTVMTGADPILLGTLVYGADGGILGTSNAFPQVCLRTYDAFQRGDMATARASQEEIQRVSEALQVGAFPAAARYLAGVAWGLTTYDRTPVAELLPEERKRIDALVEGLRHKS